MSESSTPGSGLIEMSEGVKILYKGAIDNIIFLKRQQWFITNYALVVYAGIYALRKDASPIEKTLLTVLASAAYIYALWCMIHVQSSLTKLRKSLHHIYQTYFTAEEKGAFSLWKEEPGFWYTPEFIVGLIVVHTTAFTLAVYLIWRVV